MGTHRCPTAAPRDPRYPPGTPGSIQLPPILPHDDTAPHVLPHGPMAGAGSRGWGVTQLSLTCPSCPTRVCEPWGRLCTPLTWASMAWGHGDPVPGTHVPHAMDTGPPAPGTEPRGHRDPVQGTRVTHVRDTGPHTPRARDLRTWTPRARDTRVPRKGHEAHTPCARDTDTLVQGTWGHTVLVQGTRLSRARHEGPHTPRARDLGTRSPCARDTCKTRGATHPLCEGPLVQGTRVPGAGLTLAADGPPVRGHGAVAREAVPLLQADALVAARLLRARCAGACGRPRHGETPAPPGAPHPDLPWGPPAPS